MYMTPLPVSAPLEQYQQQVDNLYAGCQAREKDALRFMYNHHPQWWRKSESEMRDTPIAQVNATNAITWYYAFKGWEALAAWVAAITEPGTQAERFEAAVDAIVAGDIPTLQTLLHNDPSLISARSLRSHHSTLLHYTGTNGVEGYRQRYPPNAVEVLQLLLAAGADVNAQAGMYGGGSTTLGLVATSIHPAKAGIMTTMLDILLKAGASIDQPGAAGNGQLAVNGCLHNGRPEAADYLARHGALLDLEGAAGVGRLDVVKSFFSEEGSLQSNATRRQMEAGFMWACEFGHPSVIEYLIAQGLDPNIEVGGMYGLHWGLIGGHLEVVQLLLQHQVSLEALNQYGGNAISCAVWAVGNSDGVYRWPEREVDYLVIIEALLKAGASIENGMLTWLAQQSDMPASTRQGLDTLFRQYGATT